MNVHNRSNDSNSIYGGNCLGDGSVRDTDVNEPIWGRSHTFNERIGRHSLDDPGIIDISQK